MTHLLTLLAQYGYLVVFAVILLENLGLPLPGGALLVVAGAFAGAGPGTGAGGVGGLVLIVLAAIAGALLGDLVWYALGRWRGRPVLGFLCRLSLNPDTCVGNTERFFLRHGMPTLLVAKFLPGLNTIAPPLLGTLRAGLGRFLAYDSGGAVIFAAVATGLGYLLGREAVDRAQAAASQMGVWLGWAALALGLAYVLCRLVNRVRVRRALRTVGLTAAELRRRQEAGESVILLDVRSALAIQEKPRRLPGALRAGFDELDAVAERLERDRPIVTYCV